MRPPATRLRCRRSRFLWSDRNHVRCVSPGLFSRRNPSGPPSDAPEVALPEVFASPVSGGRRLVTLCPLDPRPPQR
jgi:hypothetical protein